MTQCKGFTSLPILRAVTAFAAALLFMTQAGAQNTTTQNPSAGLEDLTKQPFVPMPSSDSTFPSASSEYSSPQQFTQQQGTYAMPPQYGEQTGGYAAQSQYGSPRSYVMPPQYGTPSGYRQPSQYGLQPSFGMPPQFGSQSSYTVPRQQYAVQGDYRVPLQYGQQYSSMLQQQYGQANSYGLQQNGQTGAYAMRTPPRQMEEPQLSQDKPGYSAQPTTFPAATAATMSNLLGRQAQSQVLGPTGLLGALFNSGAPRTSVGSQPLRSINRGKAADAHDYLNIALDQAAKAEDAADRASHGYSKQARLNAAEDARYAAKQAQDAADQASSDVYGTTRNGSGSAFDYASAAQQAAERAKNAADRATDNADDYHEHSREQEHDSYQGRHHHSW